MDAVRIDPKGDDQPWKRDVARAIEELIANAEALKSEVDQLKGRVN